MILNEMHTNVSASFVGVQSDTFVRHCMNCRDAAKSQAEQVSAVY